jgi:hypothetical protein
LTCCTHLFGMLASDCFYTCHLFPIRWSPYFSWCCDTCQNLHFFMFFNILKYSNFINPSYLFSCPFENLVVQSYLHLHVSLMDYLHEHEFATLLINVPSNITQTCFWFCASLAMNAWLLTCPITLAFCLSSIHFFIMLCTHLGLSHLIIAHFS